MQYEGVERRCELARNGTSAVVLAMGVRRRQAEAADNAGASTTLKRRPRGGDTGRLWQGRGRCRPDPRRGVLPPLVAQRWPKLGFEGPLDHRANTAYAR